MRFFGVISLEIPEECNDSSYYRAERGCAGDCGGGPRGGAGLGAEPFLSGPAELFGTIERVQGNDLIVRGQRGRWVTVMLDAAHRTYAHGYTVRPGIFVGAYGCATPNGVFHASQIALAADSSLYHQTISGTVQRISGDRLMVREPSRRTAAVWYVPDIDDFHVGQAVTGIGMLGANGEFYPQSINGASTAYSPGDQPVRRTSITLRGVVQRIRPGVLYVWEPAYRTTSTWFVRNSAAFRVGQNVVGTGTENTRGDFFPRTVRI